MAAASPLRPPPEVLPTTCLHLLTRYPRGRLRTTAKSREDSRAAAATAKLRAAPAPAPLMFYQGGVLGVGTPEVLVIAAVGYFLLGPEELYRLSKEIGKIVGQAREYVTKSAAEWQATRLDGESTVGFFSSSRRSRRSRPPRKNCRTRSTSGVRYSNDYSNFNTGEEQNYHATGGAGEPAARRRRLERQNNGQRGRGRAGGVSNECRAEKGTLPPAAPAAPPSSLTKAERLAEVERLYEAKRRALELEFGYEREKLAILLEEEDEEELSAAAVAAADRFEAAAEEAPASARGEPADAFAVPSSVDEN